MATLLTYDERMLLSLERLIADSIPGYARKSKQKSRLMRFFGFLLFFNKDFMRAYVTTVYPAVYFPDKTKDNAAYTWPVLAHEWVHLLRAKNHPVWFVLSYFFPHWLCALSLLAVTSVWGSPWWLLNLIWLAALAPWPAPGRYYEEWLAYRMSMAAEVWRYGAMTRYSRKFYVSQFTSSAYYFMWPFKKHLEKKVLAAVAAIERGDYDEQYPYNTVKKLVKTIWPVAGN